MSTPNWTRQLPTVSGEYWYRDVEVADNPIVIVYSAALRSAYLPSSSHKFKADELSGEFWPVPLQAPK